MTDNEKMREAFERDHEAALQEIHYCPETDRYVAVDDSDGYALDYAVAMNNEWRVHKRAWQAAKSVPDEEVITCDTCGAVTDNPWHSSRGANRHYHECDKCRELSDCAKSVPVVGEPVAYVNADALRKWESSQKDNWSGALLTARPVPGSDMPLYKAQTTSITAAELERLRKDAERYAVVRDSTYCDVYMHEIYLTDDDLDAAIDAAIAAEGEKE